MHILDIIWFTLIPHTGTVYTFLLWLLTPCGFGTLSIRVDMFHHMIKVITQNNRVFILQWAFPLRAQVYPNHPSKVPPHSLTEPPDPLTIEVRRSLCRRGLLHYWTLKCPCTVCLNTPQRIIAPCIAPPHVTDAIMMSAKDVVSVFF